MDFLKWLFRHTLASVPFGIIMMILVAGYVSIGSGFPQVREWFEANELMFFALWPFRILMALLVITLVVVTIRRIPLTPPRLSLIHISLAMNGRTHHAVDSTESVPP